MNAPLLDLLFIDDRAADRTAPVIAHVRINRLSKDYDPPRDFWLLTPGYESIEEFEAQIGQLKTELDAILRDARKRFAAR